MASSGVLALLALLCAALASGTTACVETATYEKVESQLEEAHRAAAQKDQQARTLQWQMATLDQQFRAAEQRSEAARAQLYAQVQQLVVQNGALEERLSHAEKERASLLAASALPPPVAGDTRSAASRPDDMRRMISAFETRNAQILEELARIERLLANRSHGDVAPREGPSSRGDVIDPWGGSRK
jgi:DNA repair exonuclease SbcCD ATPase subunit